MICSQSPIESSDSRYERLSRLVEQYELGQVTHVEFEQKKRRILLRQPVLAEPQHITFELLVATFTNMLEQQKSLHALQAVFLPRRGSIIDAALASSDARAKIHVREIPGMTRSGSPSVIMCICGMMFPSKSVDAGPPDVDWKDALDFVAQRGIADPVLRSLGSTLPSGSITVLVVYRSSVADVVASAFGGFDSFFRRILKDDISALIKAAVES